MDFRHKTIKRYHNIIGKFRDYLIFIFYDRKIIPINSGVESEVQMSTNFALLRIWNKIVTEEYSPDISFDLPSSLFILLNECLLCMWSRVDI